MEGEGSKGSWKINEGREDSNFKEERGLQVTIDSQTAESNL